MLNKSKINNKSTAAAGLVNLRVHSSIYFCNISITTAATATATAAAATTTNNCGNC